MVFGSDLVQSLKSELKSISGMAKGTATFISVFCIDSSASAPGSEPVGRKPIRAAMIPTAYAIMTVPMLFAHLYLLKIKMIRMGIMKYPIRVRIVTIGV
jgi:hypothetical protein